MIIKNVIHIPADSEEEKARLHARCNTGKPRPAFAEVQPAAIAQITDEQWQVFFDATDE